MKGLRGSLADLSGKGKGTLDDGVKSPHASCSRSKTLAYEQFGRSPTPDGVRTTYRRRDRRLDCGPSDSLHVLGTENRPLVRRWTSIHRHRAALGLHHLDG